MNEEEKRQVDIKGYMFDVINQHFDTHGTLSEERFTEYLNRANKAYPINKAKEMIPIK